MKDDEKIDHEFTKPAFGRIMTRQEK